MTGERWAQRASWRGGAISLAVVACRLLAASANEIEIPKEGKG
jgi:hypothetical protein